jgi:hypothetical protein
MPSWKRCLRWAVGAGVLVALALGVYHLTPPEPMCVIDGSPLRPVGDGRRVVICSSSENKDVVLLCRERAPAILLGVAEAVGSVAGSVGDAKERRRDRPGHTNVPRTISPDRLGPFIRFPRGRWPNGDDDPWGG